MNERFDKLAESLRAKIDAKENAPEPIDPRAESDAVLADKFRNIIEPVLQEARWSLERSGLGLGRVTVFSTDGRIVPHASFWVANKGQESEVGKPRSKTYTIGWKRDGSVMASVASGPAHAERHSNVLSLIHATNDIARVNVENIVEMAIEDFQSVIGVK